MMKWVVTLSLLWSVALFTGDIESSETPEYEFEKLKSPFPGYLYKPKSGNRSYPAIVFLHGSDGGNGDYLYPPGNRPHRTGRNSFAPWLARAYARQGYVTLALCYFDCRHHWGFSDYPPDELVKVDIEAITQKSIAWLRQQTYVGDNKVGIMGLSRGAEQAILLAALSTPDSAGTPDAVAALSPSDYVMEQISKETAEAYNRGDYVHWIQKPAWVYGKHTPSLKTPIAVEKYGKPLLITFFSIDPIAPTIVDLSRTRDRFENAGIDHYYRKFGKYEIDKNSFDSISATPSETIFIEYDFSGHVYPDERHAPAALRLQIQIVDWFFESHLKP